MRPRTSFVTSILFKNLISQKTFKKFVLPGIVLGIFCCAASPQARADSLIISGTLTLTPNTISFGGANGVTVGGGANGVFAGLFGGTTGTLLTLDTVVTPPGTQTLITGFATF